MLAGGWHLLIALAVLIYFLLVGYTPMKSAIWGLGTLFVLSFINKGTRMSPVDLLAALEAGIRATVPVTIACACAGLIIGSVFVSGLGLKFTQQVIEISHGNLLVLLALTGVSAIVLGMGITTTAVYITVAALIVPALIKSGIVPIAAHMFAFYFGVVSAITPPVALASFAAAAIAKTPPMATAVESTRIGIAKYIVPLVFVYDPSLLFVGPIWLTVISSALAMSGLWVLSIGLEGWYRGPINIVAAAGRLGGGDPDPAAAARPDRRIAGLRRGRCRARPGRHRAGAADLESVCRAGGKAGGMSNLFLGKPLHWLMLVVISAGLWVAGDKREHIVHFDAFIVALLAVSALCVLIVLCGTKPGERITRDEILPDETEEIFGDAGPADRRESQLER